MPYGCHGLLLAGNVQTDGSTLPRPILIVKLMGQSKHTLQVHIGDDQVSTLSSIPSSDCLANAVSSPRYQGDAPGELPLLG